MIDWNWLVGESIIADLIPTAFARYRRPIAEGLRYFLSKLPANDGAKILSGQAALPIHASAEERLVALAEQCPALHKLGQVLARDRRLDPSLRGHLQRLESLPPTTPLEAIQATLDRELGPLDRLGLQLEPPALAEASVAVVVPFRRIDGENHDLPRRGVFKLLKPHVEERLARELDLLRDLGAFLDERCAAFGIPALDYRDVFDQVREKLATELDLNGEQIHLAAAASTYAHEPRVLIPRLLPYSSVRVTAMERIDGHKVTEPGSHSPSSRKRLAELIVEALIAGPVWSSEPLATFHADPHAGNLFVTPNGRLAILDWSLIGKLGEAERIAMTKILLGALSLDVAGVRAGLMSLSTSQNVDDPALETVIGDGLRQVRHGRFPGFHWLTSLLDDAVLRARLRAAPDLILFRKALMTIEGVLADVSSEVSLDQLMPRLFLRGFMRELPRRMTAAPGSKEFTTHLSNEEISLMLMRLPSTPARAWIENCLEVLAGFSSPR